MAEAARRRGGSRSDDRRSGERRSADQLLDRELDHLPPEARWREWMHRVEATIFAASEPVRRDTLARIVGKSFSIDLLIDDIREELRGRPYDLVAVAGGWKHLTRPAYADAIRSAFGSAFGTAVDGSGRAVDLSEFEVLVLMGIAYFQPITRAELFSFFGKEISRDLIGNLRGAKLIASGPRSPSPGAPYTYVTTKAFLLQTLGQTLARRTNSCRLMKHFFGLRSCQARRGLVERVSRALGSIPLDCGFARVA